MVITITSQMKNTPITKTAANIIVLVIKINLINKNS